LVLMLTLAQTQRVPLSTLCRGSESPHCRWHLPRVGAALALRESWQL